MNIELVLLRSSSSIKIWDRFLAHPALQRRNPIILLEVPRREEVRTALGPSATRQKGRWRENK